MTIPKPILSAIFRVIRSEFKKSDKYKNCIKMNSINSGPRGGLRVRCQLCSKLFLPKEIEVDHIEDSEGPVVPYSKFYYQLDVETYYERVFNLLEVRALCKTCHSENTKSQNVKRKQTKKGPHS